jgi:phosphotriesterase-related protein
MCHIDTTIDTPALRAELAASGCTLEYDLLGCENSYYSWSPPIDMPNDLGRQRCLRWLIDRGYIGQLVISQEICFRDKLFTYGDAGHAHSLRNVVPLMREKGCSETAIGAILVDNPRRLLSFA